MQQPFVRREVEDLQKRRHLRVEAKERLRPDVPVLVGHAAVLAQEVDVLHRIHRLAHRDELVEAAARIEHLAEPRLRVAPLLLQVRKVEELVARLAEARVHREVALHDREAVCVLGLAARFFRLQVSGPRLRAEVHRRCSARDAAGAAEDDAEDRDRVRHATS